jgi:hypothetical protein
MPVVWSGVLDLFGQIWHQVGFLFAVWLLQWPELLVRKRSIVSFNKADGVLAGDGLSGGELQLFSASVLPWWRGEAEEGGFVLLRAVPDSVAADRHRRAHPS